MSNYSRQHEVPLLFILSAVRQVVSESFYGLQEDGSVRVSEPSVIMTGKPEGQEDVSL